MNKTIYPILFIILLASCRKGENIEPAFYECNFNFSDSSLANPNHIENQALIDEMTSNGLVGVTMAVYQPATGLWVGASGKADLHNDIAMKSCNVAAEEADVTILASVFDGVELRCDAFRISRAIVTLVTRAVQASRRGGSATTTTTRLRASSPTPWSRSTPRATPRSRRPAPR